MPELCRFRGIIVRMYPDDHPNPHFHAKYGEFNAAIETSPHNRKPQPKNPLEPSSKPRRIPSTQLRSSHL